MTKQLKEITIKDVSIKSYNPDNITDITQMAIVLKNYVVTQKLFTTIKGRNYAHVEGWMVAGGMLGLLPKVVAVENISTDKEKKWRADVEIINTKTGLVETTGVAICSSAEATKKSFDEYAILSMAQTRAIGKAYRNRIGWIMKLAGYEGTPSEEMRKVDEIPKEPVVNPETGEVENATPAKAKKGQVIGPDGEYTYVCSVTGDPISDQEYEYSMKIFGKALSREAQKDAKRKK